MKDIIIFGGGGHALVVIDAIEKSETYSVIGIVDPGRAVGDTVFGYMVLGNDDYGVDLLNEQPDLQGFVGIGSTEVRAACVKNILATLPDFQFATVVHPSATIGREVTLADGVFVAGGATINPCTRIGKHAIINTNASVDHDCSVGDFCHLAPNSALAGGVILGDRSMVGVCGGVIDGLTIGSDVMVGAGGMVINDLADHARVVGVPARPMS